MNDQVKTLIKRVYYILFAATFIASFIVPRAIGGLLLPGFLMLGATVSMWLKLPIFGTKNIRSKEIFEYTPADHANNKTCFFIGVILVALNYYM